MTFSGEWQGERGFGNVVMDVVFLLAEDVVSYLRLRSNYVPGILVRDHGAFKIGAWELADGQVSFYLLLERFKKLEGLREVSSTFS